MPSSLSLSQLASFAAVFSFSSTTSQAATCCKEYPGSPHWPSLEQWKNLNESVSNQLLQPLPPAAACHPNEATFNNATCAVIAAEWTNSSFHAANPISVMDNYWSNDSCLPSPANPCSGEAYPIYVVNASTPKLVKIAIDFARENNIRLVVKGTGHDYLGRSIAPNSLSIWTYYMRGIEFHNGFQPQGCGSIIDTSAVTVAAGEPFGDIYTAAAALNRTVVGPTPATVGIGGYLTGGGHSPISGVFGLGSDQVLEMDVVTAAGEFLTVNECQNTDLFWALRGGGGSTFAVITSVTIKTFPTMPIATLYLAMYSAANSAAYWGANAYLLSEYASLVASGVYGYVFTGGSLAGLVPNTSAPLSVYGGSFHAPYKTSARAAELLTPIIEHINSTWPGQLVVSVSTADFPDFYSWWLPNSVSIGVGTDDLVGSRLLDGTALSSSQAVLMQTLEETSPPGGLININLVAGPGVWNAKPRGGSDSVHPAWRKAYVEYVTMAGWTSFNTTQKDAALNALVNDYLPTLSKLAGPNPGCYINEGDPYEADFQSIFWGDNYARLLSIKRKVDPQDVFWCFACVGREGWYETADGRLCRG